MVVDAVLDAMFAVAHFVVSLFPEKELFHGTGLMGSGGGPLFQLGPYLYWINYILPLAELFEMLLVIVPIWILIMLIRFVLTLIPGLG